MAAPIQIIHHPPTGGSMVDHGRADCECEPRITWATKRRGRSQTYDIIEHFWHNELPKTEEKNS